MAESGKSRVMSTGNEPAMANLGRSGAFLAPERLKFQGAPVRVAVAGRQGSGKSGIAKLLLGADILSNAEINAKLRRSC